MKKDLSPWGPADFTPVDNKSTNPTSHINWGQDTREDDFFNAMIAGDKKVDMKYTYLIATLNV